MCIRKIITIIMLLSIYASVVSATKPVITNMSPESGEIDIEPSLVSLAVSVITSGAPSMNITFYSNLSGVWDYFYTGTLGTTFAFVENGTYRISVPFFTRNNYTYFWYINVTNTVTGEYNQSSVYNFTTSPNATVYTGISATYIASAVGLIGLIGTLGFISYFSKRRRET